jgi:hypothetical protein
LLLWQNEFVTFRLRRGEITTIRHTTLRLFGMVVSSSAPSMPVPSMPASCAEWPSRDDKRNADPTTPLRSIEKHSTMGPRNRRSLRSGPTARRGRRDDKGKGNGCIESGCRTEAFLILDPDDADRPAHLRRAHWAHPCSLRSHLLPLRLLW